jgi:flagellar basal body-associated protein FliL
MADEATSPPADAGAPPVPVKKANPFIPLAVMLVAMPAVSFVMVKSVFLPKLEKSLGEMVEKAKASAVAAENAAPLITPSGGDAGAKPEAAKPAGKDAAPAKDAHGKDAHGKDAAPAKDGHKADAAPAGGGDKEKKPTVQYSKDGWSYSFTNVVSNLTGSLGTKYVKCAFSVVSDDQNIGVIVEENKSKLRDAALTVLSARSLADMEASGAKNILRSELAANFNKALNSNVVKQIFFTEFVIQ